MRRECKPELTQEEKELLRRFLEDAPIERKWQDGKIPPPEYFMRRKPKSRRRIRAKYVIAGGALAILITAIAMQLGE